MKLSKDYYGERIQWLWGDLAWLNEKECGEPFGLEFSLSIDLNKRTGEFDGDRQWPATKNRYENHSTHFMFGRWGFYVSIRGRKIDTDGEYICTYHQGESEPCPVCEFEEEQWRTAQSSRS